jgi:hypothetical protein
MVEAAFDIRQALVKYAGLFICPAWSNANPTGGLQ